MMETATTRGLKMPEILWQKIFLVILQSEMKPNEMDKPITKIEAKKSFTIPI